MHNERLELIEELLQKNPEDSFLQYAAALEYYKTGQVKKSIKVVESLLKRDPNYLGAYYRLGKMYEEVNRIDKAIDIYKKGKELAVKQNDLKANGELAEALMILDAGDDITDW